MSGWIQSFQRQSDGKSCTLPNPQDLAVRSAYLPTFFLALGLVEFAAGDAWNLHPEGTGVGLFLAGQRSQRDWCAGTGPVLINCTGTRVWTNTRVFLPRPHHNHHDHHDHHNRHNRHNPTPTTATHHHHHHTTTTHPPLQPPPPHNNNHHPPTTNHHQPPTHTTTHPQPQQHTTTLVQVSTTQFCCLQPAVMADARPFDDAEHANVPNSPTQDLS